MDFHPSMRSKNGFIRVHKGPAPLYPLICDGYHYHGHHALLSLINEERRSTVFRSLTLKMRSEARQLKRIGFVIADDSEVLASEFLRRQAYGAKIGLDLRKSVKKGFLNPIRKMVAKEHVAKIKRRMSLTAKSSFRFDTVEQRADRIFKEDTVSLQKQDYLGVLSQNAVSHIKSRLTRLGANDSSAEEQDKDLLVKVKELSLIHRKTPLFHARKSPFQSTDMSSKDRIRQSGFSSKIVIKAPSIQIMQLDKAEVSATSIVSENSEDDMLDASDSTSSSTSS